MTKTMPISEYEARFRQLWQVLNAAQEIESANILGSPSDWTSWEEARDDLLAASEAWCEFLATITPIPDDGPEQRLTRGALAPEALASSRADGIRVHASRWYSALTIEYPD